MPGHSPRVTRYWAEFLETLPADSPMRRRSFTAGALGDSPELADRLGALIVGGRKTATCSALWEYEAEGSPIPEVGALNVVLDGCGEPLCIVETTEVTLCAYEAVGEEFARLEGEGDSSLESWRAGHWKFFARVLPSIGRQPAPDMPLVCERFRVLYCTRGD